MLHDLDKTLERVLFEEGKLNKSEIDIAFDQPTGEWATHLRRPTINCWCFDLRENLKFRSMERAVTRNDKTGRTGFPPRRVDLIYLVTAWARKVEDEHQLLWRALATLKRFPKLPPSECEGLLRYQQQDIQLLVADMSDIHVNLVDLWSVLENQMRLGFTVAATIELDVEIGFEAPLVLEAFIRVGQADEPLDRTLSAADTEIKHKAGQKTQGSSQEE